MERAGEKHSLQREKAFELIGRRRFFVIGEALLMASFEFLELGFLIGREELEHFVLHARLLDGQVDHGLGLLGCEGADLGFVKGGSFLELAHLGMGLAELLHQRLDGRLFFRHDGLDLSLLGIGEVEHVGVIAQQVIARATIGEPAWQFVKERTWRTSPGPARRPRC